MCTKWRCLALTAHASVVRVSSNVERLDSGVEFRRREYRNGSVAVS